jgi:hypothetical protein
MQQQLLHAGMTRSTPIRVTPDGAIWDGHHAARLPAEQGRLVDVEVVDQALKPTAGSILDLPVG